MLCGLVADGTVRMTWASEVMEQPPPVASSRNCADRIRGMLLGLAIGDALGNTSEGMLPRERIAHYGEIRDYLPNRHAGNRAVGLPSDDTQLAFWTLEHLLERRRIEPDALAALFCSRRIFGIGRTMRAFVREWQITKDWRRSSQCSAGNGALMRIAPVLVSHTADGSPDLWVDAVLGTAVTHNDRAAIASSVAFVGILAELLSMTAPPVPEWWIDTFVRRARPIEGDATAYERRGDLVAEPGPLWKFVDENARHSLQSPRLEANGEWYSGAFLLETVPAALRILILHAADPEEAIVRAVNDTKDNDTIAAIVGAAVGALHGESALEARAKGAKKKPSVRIAQSAAFVRDAAVAEYVKRLAKGQCDLCEKPAPFKNNRNEAYLECHHIIWLAAGGEDTIANTVALCPNCHRKMHVLNHKADKEKLAKRATARAA
jgi:ADP-ribosylglycohydrolase